MSNAAKYFDILAINLIISVIIYGNYFTSSTKFWYLTKFLDISVKLFFLRFLIGFIIFDQYQASACQ